MVVLPLGASALRDSALFLPCDASHDAVLTQLGVVEHGYFGVGRANENLIELVVPVEGYDTRFAYRRLALPLPGERAEADYKAMAVALSDRCAG